MKKLLLLLLFSVQLFAQPKLTEEHLSDIRKSILLNSLLNNADSGRFKEYYLGCDWELVLKVIDFKQPDDTVLADGEKLTFYEIYNDFFQFVNYKTQMQTATTYTHGIPRRFLLSRLNLVAVDDKNNLFYIGGSFDKSNIAGNFKLSEESPDSFITFLEMKFYNYSLENIRYHKKNRKHLFFKAHSGILNKDVTLKVNRLYYDDVIINE